MRVKWLLIFISYLFFQVVFGQPVTVNGFVYDANSREAIINAYIIDMSTNSITITNEYGYFSLTFNKLNSRLRLLVSNIAYKTDTLLLTLHNDTTINVYLFSGNTLSQVVISASKEKPIEKRAELGLVSISAMQVEKLPALGGEHDILKAYQLMPGVQSGTEGTSGLLVRGGSTDQNLILIDDVPVYYINHLAGFVSVFNNDAIKSSKLYKGAFPARYGNRLSSVLDIRMKEGDKLKFGGSASLGLLSAKILLNGPIASAKTSYLFSYRRMIYDLFMVPISRMINKGNSTGYNFQDLNFKINHSFSEKDNTFFSFYYGDDNLKLKTKYAFDNIIEQAKTKRKWGNISTAFRWNHLFGNKVFGNLTAYFTRYRFTINTQSEIDMNKTIQNNDNSFFSGIYDVGIKPALEFYLRPEYKLRLGAFAIYHTFTPGTTKFFSSINDSILFKKSVSEKKVLAFSSGAYIENELTFNTFIFNIGVRYSNYFLQNTNYQFLEPRFLAKYTFANKHSLSISYSEMHQNIHLLSNSGIGIPVDFWLPAVSEAPPSKSIQYSLGYAGSWFNSFEISMEAYYKKLSNLTTFKAGESYFGTNKTWLQKIEKGGTGTIYGLDFLIRKKFGRLTGWISYSWMKNYRQFKNINNGEKYPYKYDRTHDISIVVNYELNKNIDLSITWVYGTGQALTLPVAKYYEPVVFPGSTKNTYYEGIYIYTKKNAFRTKPYHRLDVGINFKKEKKWGKRIWNISIYNLYNRHNPYAYYFSGSSNGNTGKIELIQQSLFPLIPSISYGVKF